MASYQPSRILQAFLNSEGALRAYIRRRFRSDAMVDDICQETITRALEAETNRAIEAPEGFLFGVARNVIRKQLDAETRSILLFVEDLASEEPINPEPDQETIADDRNRMLRFMRSVSRLPPQCQRVFVMKKVYGYSHREISRKLGIAISTIEKHVATAMKRCSQDMSSGAETGQLVEVRPGDQARRRP